MFSQLLPFIVADIVYVKFKLKPWKEAINRILPGLPQTVMLNTGKGHLVLSFNRDHECADE